jgi:hypothetical protein
MRNFNFKNGLLTATILLTGLSAFGQEVCTQFSYYYSNIVGETSTIYGVTLDEEAETALLSELVFFENNSLHIAYNEQENLIYAIDDASQEIILIDPATMDTVGSPRPTSQNIGKVTAAAFDSEGNLFLGSENQNKIYYVESLDLASNPVLLEEFSTGDDVQGGDFIFTDEGFFLASRNNGKFYSVMPGDIDNVLFEGNVSAEVTGMAEHQDGGFIISPRNSNTFLRYEINTDDESISLSEVSYSISVEGAAQDAEFALGYGDMTSGCSQFKQVVENDCEDFRTYLIHKPSPSAVSTLYAVDLNNPGIENLEFIAEVNDSHLGVGPDGLLYIVRSNGSSLMIMDPSAPDDAIEVDLSANGLGNTPAVAVSAEGILYVGSASQNKIFTINTDLGSADLGLATYYGDADVNGGDLIFLDGELWVANRDNSSFTNVDGMGSFIVAADEMLGASVLADGNILVANGDQGSTLDIFEPGTGNLIGEFETGLPLFWGDLASRCFDGLDNEDECENYVIYLSDTSNGGTIYSVTLSEGTASLEAVLSNVGGVHLAFDESNGLLYVVKGSGQVGIYDPATGVLSTFANIAMGSMNINQTFAAVVTNEGNLLIGSANQNKVYEVDPATGAASMPIDVPVQGGDLVQTNDGNVWLINRGQNRFYNITDGVSQFDVPELDEMYGAAVLADGSILIGDAGSQLRVVDPATGMVTEASFDLGFSVSAGDLAAGCSDNNPIIIDEPENPFCTNETVFVNESDNIIRLTAMGWAQNCDDTYGMRWRIRNGSGEAIEAFYNFAGAPELQGPFSLEAGEAVYFTSGTFDANNFSMTMRVFVDGEQVQVKAHGGSTTDLAECNPEGCPDDQEGLEISVFAESASLTAFPNPTENISNIEITTSKVERAVVEVFDMNGRSVAQLLNQDVQPGAIYRLTFDGTGLNNGIYVVKYITSTETVIEKIMIAR